MKMMLILQAETNRDRNARLPISEPSRYSTTQTSSRLSGLPDCNSELVLLWPSCDCGHIDKRFPSLLKAYFGSLLKLFLLWLTEHLDFEILCWESVLYLHSQAFFQSCLSHYNIAQLNVLKEKWERSLYIWHCGISQTGRMRNILWASLPARETDARLNQISTNIFLSSMSGVKAITKETKEKNLYTWNCYLHRCNRF